MRGLIIARYDGERLSTAQRDALAHNGHNMELQVWRFGQPDRRIIETLVRGYDFILVPMELPYFSAVRMAELAKSRNYPTRVIVTTKPGQKLNLAKRLFDTVMVMPFSSSWLADELRRPLRRSHKGRTEIVNAVVNILRRLNDQPMQFCGDYETAYTKYAMHRRPLLWDTRLYEQQREAR